jgi:hypothetical protein
MDQYDQYDRFDKYNNVVKKNHRCEKKRIKSLLFTFKRKLESKKLTKNNRLRKNILINRTMISTISDEEIKNDDIMKIFDNCFCWFFPDPSCMCHRLRFDEYNMYFQEFDQMFRKRLKYIDSNSTKSIFRSNLIDFFCQRIPMFFRIVMYGDIVMSMISGIPSHCIDMIVYDANELRKFMIIIFKLFEPYDMNHLSYVIHMDRDDGFTIKNDKNILDHIQGDKIYCVVSCVCFFNQIDIRFNIRMKNKYSEDWYPDLGFIETQIMFGKIIDMHDQETSARIGTNEIGFAVHQSKDDNIKETYDIVIVKNNLANRTLTVTVGHRDHQIYRQARENINLINRYYHRIAQGYRIPCPCPLGNQPDGMILHFGYMFEQFDNLVYCTTKINTDLNRCIYEYLQINGTICTYCNQLFKNTDENQNQLIAVTPACKCGKIEYDVNDKNRNKDQNEDQDQRDNERMDLRNDEIIDYGNQVDFFTIYDRRGWVDHCGKKENPCNAFHVDCFLTDENNFIGPRCNYCLHNVFTGLKKR